MTNFDGSFFKFPLMADEFNVFDKIKENICAICLEPFLDNMSVNIHLRLQGCGHLFHTSCIKLAKACGGLYENENGKFVSKPCPVCRSSKNYYLANEIFIDEIKSINERKNYVHINLCTKRGGVINSDLFVDDGIKMIDIMISCLKMLGHGTNLTPLMNPKPVLIRYLPDMKYSPFDDKYEKKLSDYGINNNDKIDMFLSCEYN
jgi:hypothetical protein